MAVVNVSGNLNELRRHLNRNSYKNAANLMNELAKREHFVAEVKRVPGLSSFLANLHTKAVATRSKRRFNPNYKYPNFPGAPARRLHNFIPLYVKAYTAQRQANARAGPSVNMGNTEAAERNAAEAARLRKAANEANERARANAAAASAREAAAARNAARAAKLRKAANEANERARANAAAASAREAAAARNAARAARNAAASRGSQARKAAAAAARAARNAAERAKKAANNIAARERARGAGSSTNTARNAAAAAAATAARRAKAARNAAAAKNARNAAAENEKMTRAVLKLTGPNRATLSRANLSGMRRNLLTVNKRLLSTNRQANYNRYLANLNTLISEPEAAPRNFKRNALNTLRYRLKNMGPVQPVKLMAKRYQRQYGNLPANLIFLL